MMLRQATLLSLVAAAAFALLACDSGDTNVGNQPATDNGAGTDTTVAQDTANNTPDAGNNTPDVGNTPDPGTPTPDTNTTPDTNVTPPPLEYPPGPYGYAVGDISPDIELYDPFAGKWIKFSDYYMRYDKRVLFISSAAGWCGPCQAEAVELVQYYDQFEDEGLEPLYALFEDKQGISTTIGSVATGNFIAAWKNDFGVDYPLFIDPPRVPGDPNSFALAPFWESDGIPFAFMITTHDMKIRWKVHGYSPFNITFQILTNLEIASDFWATQF